MKLISLFAVGAAAFLTACGGLKVKVDPEGMKQAKKVAIVGFHIDMEEPKSVVGDFQKLSSLAKGNVEDAVPESDTADQIYATLATRLNREMNWDVKPIDAVRSNAQYKELYLKYTKGFQVRGMKGEGMKTLRAHGIVDAEPVHSKMSQADREKLMDALGVNAIVADNVLATLKNESTMGGMIGRAKYKPRTQNIIRVFVRGKPEPVWFDTWAWGEGDEAIQANANYIANEDLLKQVKISADKSMTETFKRYKAL